MCAVNKVTTKEAFPAVMAPGTNCINTPPIRNITPINRSEEKNRSAIKPRNKGAIIAAIGIAVSSAGKRGRAKTGLVLNCVVIVVATWRLGLGGGLI